MTTYQDFFTEMLTTVRLPVNTHTLDAFGIVSILEGVNNYWNPLNSVIPVPGSRSLPGNTANVQMYTSERMGIEGSVALLHQPRWSWVLMACLYAGDRALILHEFDVQYQTWGSRLPWFAHSTAEAKARLAMTMAST